MTGRGRGRLFKNQNSDQSNNSLPTATAPDIKQLFIGQRSGPEVYRILKHHLLTEELQKNKLRSCLELIIRNMIVDGTNTIEICKYLYVCSCSSKTALGNEIWSQFYSILEAKFREIQSQKDVETNEEAYHHFTKFFITAVHLMRNPVETPKGDIVSALLILISKLKKTSESDRSLFCQAVAWMGSYKDIIQGGSVIASAYIEAVNQVREWLVNGEGGHWGMACLEAASQGTGVLPPNSRDFYQKHLSRASFSALVEQNILIPASDKALFNLPHIESIQFID